MTAAGSFDYRRAVDDFYGLVNELPAWVMDSLKPSHLPFDYSVQYRTGDGAPAISLEVIRDGATVESVLSRLWLSKQSLDCDDAGQLDLEVVQVSTYLEAATNMLSQAIVLYTLASALAKEEKRATQGWETWTAASGRPLNNT